MPDPARKMKAPDPTLDAGDADGPVLPCMRNDVEVVGDLEEPNTIEFESGPEDDEPASIVFTAMVHEPGVGALRLGSGEPEGDEPGSQDLDETGPEDGGDDTGQPDSGTES